ncbi:hypothetical protein SDRG_06323 [Saprolegnia diclina VS20]|uniref:Uncharacterized protein n=1 Tax=Saprolegnia diclina (strain VS20) TaxID=1156394 RepID=T0QQN2_SAPDV|nr:hypothetical protein SDRG_06323 [Saprolegnia diclina VS20]EQC36215.1 hypothetical protein SDRG_06323 [Saprolegnia diclina VS20]|eukprot:XP_008610321.1 hypothetical protein SDRG_06323 [Saprolegnia diclina VS20]
MMLCPSNESMPRYSIAFQEPTATKFSSRYADYHEECITEYYRQECLLAFYRLQNTTERPRKKRKRRCVTFADVPEIVGVADASVDRDPVPTARISRDEMKQLLDERVFPSSAKRPRTTMLYH